MIPGFAHFDLADAFGAARLRVRRSPDEMLRIERVVAVARIFVAATTLGALWLEDIGLVHATTPLWAMLALYLLHSVLAVFLLQRRRQLSGGYVFSAHLIDMTVAATATLVTSGPSSPLFLLFIFVLLAAAARWGFWETLATAMAVTAILMAEALLLTMSGLYGGAASATFTFGDLVVRTGYINIIGLLLGYFAEETRQLRAEGATVAHLQSALRLDRGLTPTLELLAAEILQVVRASHMAIAIEDIVNGRLFRWDARTGWVRDPDRSTGDLAAAERSTYWSGPPADSVFAARRSFNRGYRVWAIDERGEPAETAEVRVPPELAASYRFRRVLIVPFELPREWKIRVFVFDPSVDVLPESLLRFMRMLLRQVAPGVLNVYLLGRLRARASAIERGRIARELHDGFIQTLLGTQLALAAVRRQLPDAARVLEPDLARLEENLQREVANVRDLIQQMRPVDVAPQELPDHLADIVARFERETGITTRFSCDLTDFTLPPRVCRELVRILQEALANVRRHAGAHTALVWLTARDGRIALEIDDDGHGFPFEGFYTLRELDARRRGPYVIKERVRTIGGELAIHSSASGSKLLITVPQEEVHV